MCWSHVINILIDKCGMFEAGAQKKTPSNDNTTDQKRWEYVHDCACIVRACMSCKQSDRPAIQDRSINLWFFVSSALDAGISDTSTVPASTPDAKAMARSKVAADKWERLKTPPPGILKCDEKSSAPKLSRAVQSKRLLEEPSDLPDDPAHKKRIASEGTAAVRTAAKAKADKRVSFRGGGGNGSTPTRGAKVEPKQEKQEVKSENRSSKTPGSRRSQLAVAVQESIHRGATKEIEEKETATKKNDKTKDKKEKTKDKDARGSKDDGSEYSEDPQDNPELVEQQRLKRENHARFMRFSRSLKSGLHYIKTNARSSYVVYAVV